MNFQSVRILVLCFEWQIIIISIKSKNNSEKMRKIEISFFIIYDRMNQYSRHFPQKEISFIEQILPFFRIILPHHLTANCLHYVNDLGLHGLLEQTDSPFEIRDF